MRYLTWIGAAGAALLLTACGTQTARVPRILGARGGLVYSNAIMVLEQRQPHLQDGTLRLEYAILLENRGAQLVAIDLTGVEAGVDGQPVFTHCLSYSGSQNGDRSLTVAPENRARIECELTLSPAAMQRVATGDRDLLLALPLPATLPADSLIFAYYLRLEDAQ